MREPSGDHTGLMARPLTSRTGEPPSTGITEETEVLHRRGPQSQLRLTVGSPVSGALRVDGVRQRTWIPSRPRCSRINCPFAGLPDDDHDAASVRRHGGRLPPTRRPSPFQISDRLPVLIGATGHRQSRAAER